MPVRTYDIPAIRPLAPSEQAKSQTTLARRVLGGATLVGGAGAGLGAYLGRTPAKAALGAGLGAGIGAVHGGLRAREQSLGDVVTQERMAMREALRAARKRKKAGVEIPLQENADMEIHPVTLRAMCEELAILQKEAGMGSFLGGVGKQVLRGGGRVAGMLGQKKQFGGLVGKGIKSLGGGAAGSQRLRKGIGGAALGATALGVGGFAAGRMSKRPQPAGY